jgi:hypothetical protein
MERSRKPVFTRLGRVLAVLGLAAAGSVVAMQAPAQSATIITVTQSITTPGLIRHQIDVHLPMNQFDAQGYINNGARIEVECWGDDPIADDLLPDCPRPGFSGTVTYSGSQLQGTPTGVHLTIVNLYERGTVLDEDIPDGDEIYIKARWIDDDGHVLKGTSSTVSGSF